MGTAPRPTTRAGTAALLDTPTKDEPPAAPAAAQELDVDDVERLLVELRLRRRLRDEDPSERRDDRVRP